MDYYVIINGQKQGPYDILGFIKKVKNGLITESSQVSTHEEGPFRPASEIEELKTIINSEANAKQISGKDSIALDAVLNEGADLWTRRVAEYTIFFGLIVVAGFSFSSVLRGGARIFSDYPFIPTYFSGVLTLTLTGLYCYYVLMTKRSQDPDTKEIKSLIKVAVGNLIVYSAIISLATLPVGVNKLVTIISVTAAAIVLTLTIFVPFLIVDHRMSLKRSVKVSLETFLGLKANIKLALLVIVLVNIGAIFLPGLLNNVIFLLGIVITLPVSLAILANIYDQLLA